MTMTCCVPGCRSNYKKKIGGKATAPYVTVFKFPSEAELFKKWMEAIPRTQWCPTKHSKVCIKHFSREDLNLGLQITYPNGESQFLPYGTPRLRPGACPKLFGAYVIEDHDSEVVYT